MVKSITLSEVLTSKLQFGITLTAADIIISLTITFLTALYIYLIYKKTYSGVLYSHDFNITLIIVSMVVAVIMIGISRNLALSLGLIGALSIVRFRNAVKDPKDVTFLFWAISVGIVNGVQFYKLSIISSIFIGAILLVFSSRFTIQEPYVLIIKYSKIDENLLVETLKKHCHKYKMRSATLSKTGDDKTIEVKLKKGAEQKLLTSLKHQPGINQVMMFSYTGKLSE